MAVTRRALVFAALLAVAATACGTGSPSVDGGSATLRVSGSTTVNPVAADAAEALRAQGLRVTVDASGGSAGGIAQLAQGQVEVAMSSKPIVDDDRRAWPAATFVSAQIGADAVGIVARREVVDGGVRSLGKAQLRALFEGRVRNWKELGGPDLEVFVYDKEPGRGTREVLDRYLYGSTPAPPPARSDRFAIVGGNEEGRTKVLSTPGGVTPLSTAFIAGSPGLAAIAVDGVDATKDNIGDNRYPLARPLYLVTNGPPAGPAATFVNYVLSPAGQDLVREHGYLTVADLGSR